MSEPQKYREMSAEERRPWDIWMQAALDKRTIALAAVIMKQVKEALDERDEIIRKLERDVAVLTESRKSWWR